MAKTAFLFINGGFGNVGAAPPGNALVYADIVVKDEHDAVVYSQQAGCSTPLSVLDNHTLIAARLIMAARDLMSDSAMNVVIL